MTPEVDDLLNEMRRLTEPLPDAMNATRVLTVITHLSGRLRVAIGRHEEHQMEQLIAVAEAQRLLAVKLDRHTIKLVRLTYALACLTFVLFLLTAYLDYDAYLKSKSSEASKIYERQQP